MRFIAVASVLASLAFAAGCNSNRIERNQSEAVTSSSLPSSTFVWSSFREAHGRWPTNIVEVEEYLIADYTNIISRLREDYLDAVFIESPDGSLTIRGRNQRGEFEESIW